MAVPALQLDQRFSDLRTLLIGLYEQAGTEAARQIVDRVIRPATLDTLHDLVELFPHAEGKAFIYKQLGIEKTWIDAARANPLFRPKSANDTDWQLACLIAQQEKYDTYWDYAAMAGRVTAFFGLSVATALVTGGIAPIAAALVGGLGATWWDTHEVEEKIAVARANLALGEHRLNSHAYLDSLEQERRYVLWNDLIATLTGSCFAKIVCTALNPVFVEAGKGLIEGLITACTDGRIMNRSYAIARQRLEGAENPDEYSCFTQIALTAAMSMGIPAGIEGLGRSMMALKRMRPAARAATVCYARCPAPPRSWKHNGFRWHQSQTRRILPEDLALRLDRFPVTADPHLFNKLAYTTTLLHEVGVPDSEIGNALIKTAPDSLAALRAVNALHPKKRELDILKPDLDLLSPHKRTQHTELTDTIYILLRDHRVPVAEIRTILRRPHAQIGKIIADLRALPKTEPWISRHDLRIRRNRVFALVHTPLSLQHVLLKKYSRCDPQMWELLVSAVDALAARRPPLSQDRLRAILHKGDHTTAERTLMTLYRVGTAIESPQRARARYRERDLDLLRVDESSIEEKRIVIASLIDKKFFQTLLAQHRNYHATIFALRSACDTLNDPQVAALYYIHHRYGQEAVLGLFNESLLMCNRNTAPLLLGYLSDLAVYINHPDVLDDWFTAHHRYHFNFVDRISRYGVSSALPLQGAAFEFMYAAQLFRRLNGSLIPNPSTHPDYLTQFILRGQDTACKPDAFAKDLGVLIELTSAEDAWALDVDTRFFEHKLSQIEAFARLVAENRANAIRLQIIAKHPDKVITQPALHLLRRRVKEITGRNCLIIQVMDMDDFLVYPPGTAPRPRFPVQTIEYVDEPLTWAAPTPPRLEVPASAEAPFTPAKLIDVPAAKGGFIPGYIYQKRLTQLRTTLPTAPHGAVKPWLAWPEAEEAQWQDLLRMVQIARERLAEEQVIDILNHHGATDLDRAALELRKRLTALPRENPELKATLLHRLQTLDLSKTRDDLSRLLVKQKPTHLQSLRKDILRWDPNIPNDAICITSLHYLKQSIGEIKLIEFLQAVGSVSLRRVLLTLPAYLASPKGATYIKQAFSTKRTDWPDFSHRFEIIGQLIALRPNSVIPEPTLFPAHASHFRNPGQINPDIHPHAIDTELGLLFHAGHFSIGVQHELRGQEAVDACQPILNAVGPYADFIHAGRLIAPHTPATGIVLYATGVRNDMLKITTTLLEAQVLGGPGVIAHRLEHIAAPAYPLSPPSSSMFVPISPYKVRGK